MPPPPCYGRADETIRPGNTIEYSICPATGCPVAATFDVAGYEAAEGDSVEVVVTLDGTLAEDVTIPIRVSDSSAVAPDLYNLSTESLTFPAGETSQTFTVTALENDQDAEPEISDLVLEFGDLPAVVRTGMQAFTAVSISDNDAPSLTVAFGMATVAAIEGGAAATVSVILNAVPERELTIPITAQVQNGATADDFSGVPASVTFGAQETEQSFSVTAVEEDDKDLGEGLQLGFGELPEGVSIGDPANATVELRDNDSDGIRLEFSPATLAEDAGAPSVMVTATLDLTSSASLASDLRVPLTFSGTAMADDYSGEPPEIMIPAGSRNGATATVEFILAVTDDLIVERNETIVLGAMVDGFNVVPAEAALTDDDTAYVIAAAPVENAIEGREVPFEFLLSQPVDAEVTVAWSAADGGAMVAEDLDSTSGSVTFPANSEAGAMQTVRVSVRDDDLSESDETFTLTIGEVTAPGIAADRFLFMTDAPDLEATIAASDPLMASLAGPARSVEGTTATYTINVTGGVSTEDVRAELVIGDASTAGADDYTLSAETVTVPAGQAEAAFTIDLAADEVMDDEETLVVILANVSGGGGEISVDASAASVTTTIREALIVALGMPPSTSLDEGGTFAVPVTVTPPPERADLTVTYMLTPDSASADDYEDAGGGSITIAAGQAGGTIRLTAVDDNLSEGAESFGLTLTGVTSSAAGAEPAELSPEPSDNAVEVTISASDPLTASLTGPERVREGQMATYTLSLDGGTSTADVEATLAVGAASTANERDYTPFAPTVIVRAGRSEATVSVAIAADDVREGDETLVLEIAGANGGGGGGIMPNPGARRVSTTITELDLEARARAMKLALAGFGRTVGDNVVEMIEERAQGPAAGDSYVRLGGQDLAPLPEEAESVANWVLGAANGLGLRLGNSHEVLQNTAEMLAAGGEGPVYRSDPRHLVSNSAFQYTLSGNGAEERAASWSLWGRGDASGFEGRFDDFSMNGDAIAAHVGMDLLWRSNMLVGVALSRREGTVDYDFLGAGGDSGRIKMDMFSAHPYLHWSLREGLSVWGTLGVGWGSAELSDAGGGVDTKLGMRMAAVGTRGELLSMQYFDLALKADAYQVQIDAEGREDLPAVDAESTRLRLALESRATRTLQNGALLTASVELGLRVDGGDASSGDGAEVGGSLAFSHPGSGLGIEARGRYLLTSGKNDFEQWGASVTLTVDPGASGRGLQASLIPTYGQPSSGVEGLWHGAGTSDAFLYGDSAMGLALAARIGYGLSLPGSRGLLTPFGELGMQDGVSRRLRLGAELGGWKMGHSALGFELYGEQLGTPRHSEIDHRIVMKARWDF